MAQGLPPLTGVITDGNTSEDALKNAREALTGILGSMLVRGDDIPDPGTPEGKEKDVYWIEPELKVAIPILVRKARLEAGMTLEKLPGNAGVTCQQIQNRERSGTNPTIFLPGEGVSNDGKETRVGSRLRRARP